MEHFNYLIEVSICLTAFFAFYLVFLRRLTFFRFNRFFLLGSLVLSFAIPFFQININREVIVEAAAAEAAVNPAPHETALKAAPVWLKEKPVAGTAETAGAGPFAWAMPLYMLIVAGLLLLAGWRLYRLFAYTAQGMEERDGLKLIKKESGFTNCSFFNYVFIDEKGLSEAELDTLLSHEEVHVKQYHSIDKLVLMVARAVLWFNPLIYVYDKALEEMHEFEADEIASAGEGRETYAGILLQLAISSPTNSLLHHFVKKPIKQRIKMLFNPKSKSMKKIIYLLALPLGLMLTYSFTVKMNIHQKIAPVKERKLTDSLLGKTVKGVVKRFEKVKSMEFFILHTGKEELRMDGSSVKGKIKTGDELSVVIGASMTPPLPLGGAIPAERIALLEKPVYMPYKITDNKGLTLYQYTAPEYAFLYETNRARFAWSKIKSIERNSNGTLKQIVLQNKGFTINLNVAAQQFRSKEFKPGDSVLVKFIGERLTAKNTYTTDKLIALYSQPKGRELINKVLYPKFYEANGKQKVYNRAGQKPIAENNAPVKPYLLTSSATQIDNTNKTMKIEDAVFEWRKGNKKVSDLAIRFNAADSSRTSKTNNEVELFGDAMISNGILRLKAAYIKYNRNTHTVEAKNVMINDFNYLLVANEVKMDFNETKAVFIGPVFMKSLNEQENK